MATTSAPGSTPYQGRFLRVTRLELFGWSWFADRTILDLSHPVTCLVSDHPDHARTILEAIRWCLTGATPAHCPVFYPGSPYRRTMSIVEVTVVSSWMDGDHAVTRRRTRDMGDGLFWDGQLGSPLVRALPILVQDLTGHTWTTSDFPALTVMQRVLARDYQGTHQKIAIGRDDPHGGYRVALTADGVLVAQPLS